MLVCFKEPKLFSTIKFDEAIHVSPSVGFVSYSFSYYHDGISALQAWLARTIQKLDSRLLGVCQTFSEESYLTVSIYLFVCALGLVNYICCVLT
jgi:hypothetical protein